MAKNLVIVESPAKVKTIKKFLGSNYQVLASYGHVRDLPKSQLGVDIDKDYEPKYITIRGKGDVLSELRKEVKKADKIYLATDPDREGEAISWHLKEALKLDEKKVSRITFNEITKTAVKESFKNARDIDMNLVDSQQTRRILDRIVGYKISPLLWAKIKRGLSAGRVQSAALRIICDREAEIDAFVPKEYWSVEAILSSKDIKGSLKAKYAGEVKNRAEAEKIAKDVAAAAFTIDDIKVGDRARKAPLPFTTSTLQQEASKALNFSTQKTMRLAQQLYEGVELDEGTVGIITYLRTDSTRIADEALASSAEYVGKTFGKEYLKKEEAKESNKGRIQDAHEAIRPTSTERTPLEIKDRLSRDQFRLYQLIWKRFVASRMADATYETTSVKLSAGAHKFTMSASKLKFDGFMKVYMETGEDESTEETEENSFSGNLTEKTKLKLEDVEKKQHFTQPPAHFTEASLVRTMEEMGIGRPSTYSPTISTILARHYVTKEGRNIFVTELGEVVNKLMVDAFPTIVDSSFTANMETLLDGIEEGNIKWKTVVENFYPDLADAVAKAEEEISKVSIRDEESDEICENCGRRMVIKYGPHGKFLACPGFPECKNTKPYFEKIGVACPKCGKDIVVKKTKKGRRFYGCIANPECDFMVWQKPSAQKCEKCGSLFLEKGGKLVCSNPECGNVKEKSE
ncbi:MAG: type I DNA topoisomerase [Lachnospiraceae bacterium]|nr:type I DNA topoisomerase [Lachnospiraceae bacterium]